MSYNHFNMFSIHNNSRFESFIQLINQAFNARTKDALIDALYEHLPKVFGGPILVFLPSLLHEGILELEVPQFTEFTAEEEKLILKIKRSYESGNTQYPAIIDGWFVTTIKIKSELILLFGVDNKALEKMKVSDEQRDDILSVIATLLFRIDAMEEESQRNIKLEKEKLRTQILSSVSHDLKTPLAAIIGSLSILTTMGQKITEEQHDDLIATSVSEAHRLNNFITNILNMARIESGVVKAHTEWQPVDVVIKHIQKCFRLKYPERVLKVSDIPGYINFNIDPVLFEQMIMIILDNATKYSPPASEIELTIERNKNLDFLIKDHGKGIPDNMQEKIFDKYTRLKMEDRKIAGTGLGLAIAKALADLQNLGLSAYNNETEGAIFKISCKEWKM